MSSAFRDARADTTGTNGTTNTIPAVAIEDYATTVKEGDAKTTSKLVIDNDYIDSDNSCELCTKIVYTPGTKHVAGIAYKDEKLDFGNAKRIVFFARADPAQEVSFVAIGNDTHSSTANDTDIFQRINWAIVTENVTLSDNWQRFQISVNDTALSDAVYPFGIQLASNSSQKQIFYIKGVTMDNKPAINPMRTIYDSLNSTLVNSTLTAKIDANSTSSNTPATIEFGANSTGGLTPYSFVWNFGDGNNGTNTSEKVSHTFDKPGDYNITLSV